MVALLDPEWNLDGPAAAQDLQRSVRAALQERLAELKAPASGLRSRLLRALPTTMALVALQRREPGGDRWACHLLWAGDSRAYVFQPGAGRPAADHRRHPRPRGRDGEPAGGLGGEQRDVRRHRLRRPPPQGRADRAVPGDRRHRRLLRVPALTDALRAPGARGAAGRPGHRQLVGRGAGGGQRGHRRRRRDGRARRRRRPRRLPGAVRRRTAELEQRWITPLDDLDAELREQSGSSRSCARPGGSARRSCGRRTSRATSEYLGPAAMAQETP